MTDTTPHDVPGCLACDLTQGRQELPGGRIHSTKYWVVEHCIGPLGVGSLIIKPLRHCLQVADLSADEAAELGPLLKQVTSTIQQLVGADQIYVCLWSHMGWAPGHIHFVLQPSWNQLGEHHEKPGPFLQVDMFSEGEAPPHHEIQEFADRARSVLASPVDTAATSS